LLLQLLSLLEVNCLEANRLLCTEVLTVQLLYQGSRISLIVTLAESPSHLALAQPIKGSLSDSASATVLLEPGVPFRSFWQVLHHHIPQTLVVAVPWLLIVLASICVTVLRLLGARRVRIWIFCGLLLIGALLWALL